VASDGDDRPGLASGGAAAVSLISVPETRDYQRINAELVQRLDAGLHHVRLAGVEGQRLLASGLTGPWRAVVEVEGSAGPELAAGLNAPGLIVVCSGRAADGAGAGLTAGRLVVRGPVGAGVGYAMRGGVVVVCGDADARAGLNQSGGVLVLFGMVGPLAGERQSGGALFARPDRTGPHSGRGRRGGRFLPLPPPAGDLGALDTLREALAGLDPWLPSDWVIMEKGARPEGSRASSGS
jgi:hypothetical protein